MLIGARQFFVTSKTMPLPYDAEVEYLESTGSQWIDTGITGRENMLVSCRLSANTANASNNFLVAADGGSSSTRFWIVTPSSGIRCAAITSVNTIYSPLDANWHDVSVDTTSGAKKAFVDGVLAWSDSGSSGAVETVQTLKLFARTAGTGTVNMGYGKLASFSIKDTLSNLFLIDSIPVRFTNELGQSEGAMYDRVSGELFRNAGTDTFLYGNDIVGGS